MAKTVLKLSVKVREILVYIHKLKHENIYTIVRIIKIEVLGIIKAKVMKIMKYCRKS